MRNDLRMRVRRDLDEDLRFFRGGKIRRSRWGWLRGVRQALGMPVADVARRMKVGQSEIFRLEMAEARDSITLKKLRATAAAMGCELVYAVVPVNGTLEDLARELDRERKLRAAKGQRRNLKDKSDPYGLVRTIKSVLTLAGWHDGRR